MRAHRLQQTVAMIDYDTWGPGSAGAIDFEVRMRRRRFMHCVKRCEAAIMSGALDEARLAVDEARELIPDASEVVVLDAWLTDSVNGSAPSTTALAFQGDDDDVPASDERLQVTPELADTGPDSEGKGVLLTRRPLAVLPLAIVGLLGFALGHISAARSYQAQPTAISADALARGDEKLTDEGPQPAPPVVVPVALVQGKSAQEKPVQELRDQDAAVRADGVATAIAGLDRAPRDAAAAAAPAATSGTSIRRPDPQRRPPSPTSSAAAGDAEEIRAVLKRYEVAYNRFVARMAKVGSSGAKPGLLMPSSNGSLAGRISLGVCDVTVSGEVGTARCAGTASSNAKMGRNSTTPQRQRAFDLRKDVDGWRIGHLPVE